MVKEVEEGKKEVEEEGDVLGNGNNNSVNNNSVINGLLEASRGRKVSGESMPSWWRMKGGRVLGIYDQVNLGVLWPRKCFMVNCCKKIFCLYLLPWDYYTSIITFFFFTLNY